MNYNFILFIGNNVFAITYHSITDEFSAIIKGYPVTYPSLALMIDAIKNAYQP